MAYLEMYSSKMVLGIVLLCVEFAAYYCGGHMLGTICVIPNDICLGVKLMICHIAIVKSNKNHYIEDKFAHASLRM